jgi:ribokinase
MVGAVGNDDFGAALLADLDRAAVDRSAVATIDGTGSGMSVAIFDDDGDYGAVIVSGANLLVRAEQAADPLLLQAKILALQNEIPETVNVAVARRARDHGLLTVLNAAPARPFETDLPGLVDLLVVNAIEAEMLGGGKVGSLAGAAAAAEMLSASFAAAIVTAGGDGVAFARRSDARLALGAAMNDALDAANREAARWVSLPIALRSP